MDFAAAMTVFSDIYDRNAWHHGSGTGSLPETTGPYREMLVRFLRDNAIASVVDFGCGDWQFARLMDWTGIDYLGLDVVPAVVAANRARFAAPGIRFETVGALADLPPADLLLCKDVLQHLPLEEIEACLAFFATRYRFALVTNDVLPDTGLNAPVPHGACRPLRLDLPPFGRAAAAVLRWPVRHGEDFSVKETRLLVRDGDALAAAARLRDRVATLEAGVDALQAGMAAREAAVATLEADLAALQADLAARDAAAVALRARLETAETALAAATAEGAALRASTSWRVTAPLRALARRFGR